MWSQRSRVSVPHSAVEIFNTPSDAISRSKCGWALDFFLIFLLENLIGQLDQFLPQDLNC